MYVALVMDGMYDFNIYNVDDSGGSSSPKWFNWLLIIMALCALFMGEELARDFITGKSFLF